MNADWIGITYAFGMILFWGFIFGSIFAIFKFIKQKNDYNKEVLNKLDDIIRLLKE